MSQRQQMLLTSEQYEKFRSLLGECEWFFQPGRTLFALSLGGHRASTFDAITLNPEISVVWRGSCFPPWARPFGLIVAAYGGAVKVTGRRGLEIVRDNLLCMSSVELLLVETNKATLIEQQIAALGRNAIALGEGNQLRENALGVIFVDDDASDSIYPVIYEFADGVRCPLIEEMRAPAR